MILVTGASGQIGIDLVGALRQIHGSDAVIASDLKQKQGQDDPDFRFLDVTDNSAFRALLKEVKPDSVYHLAGILSANGENYPDRCWNVNINGLKTVLDEACKSGFRLFWPSSIAVFGPGTPQTDTHQDALTSPTTMYGLTKVAGELLCQYYATRYDVDARSIRFPGVISYSAPPGGGTTDFAVEMFFEAIRTGSYSCFVREDTRLPMMYMSDAIKSILDLMSAPVERITVRTSYNVTAFSRSAAEFADAIQEHIPSFMCRYDPDYRQAIADSWPQSIDDSRARDDWGWTEHFDFQAMTTDMIANVRKLSGLHGATDAESEAT